MSLISQLSCKMGRHEPLRRDVEWDGRHYVGECRHCGTAIQRVARRSWRAKPEITENA